MIYSQKSVTIMGLGRFGGGATAAEMQAVIEQVWGLAKAAKVPTFLA